jgi:hypothetical protein
MESYSSEMHSFGVLPQAVPAISPLPITALAISKYLTPLPAGDEEDSGDMGPWSRVESLKPAGDIWVDPESETAQPSWEVSHGESGESADDKDASRTELYAAGEVWEELIVYKKTIIKPSDINQVSALPIRVLFDL